MKAIKAYRVRFGCIEKGDDIPNYESYTVLASDATEAIEVAAKNLERIKRGRTVGKIKGDKYPSEVELLIESFD